MTEKELQELEVFEKEHHKLDRNTILEFDIDKNVIAKQKKVTELSIQNLVNTNLMNT